MKRLLYILILLAAHTAVMAQGMLKLGNGKETGRVQLVVDHDGIAYGFDVDDNRNYNLWSWNGASFKRFGVISDLPKHGSNTDGDFELVDALSYDGKLYVIGSYKEGHTSIRPNVVLEWDGSSWTDLTDKNIEDAAQIAKLVIYGGKLYIVGIFPTTGLVVFDGSSWSETGDELGIDPALDYVIDAEVYAGRIYASGQFTKPGGPNPRYSTMYFRDGKWHELKNPPYLHQSMHFSQFNNALYLTGEANMLSDYIKANSGGSVWDDVSEGLDNVEITEFWDYEGTSEMQCLTGVFHNRDNGDKFNFLIKDDSGWHFGENKVIEAPIYLAKVGNDIYAHGDFDLANLSNVGKLTNNQAILSGWVFLDENNNCILDSNEKGIPYASVTLEPEGVVFYTNRDGSYEIPVDIGVNYTLSFVPQSKHAFGCSKVVTKTVTEHINYMALDLVAVEIPNIVDLELSSRIKNGWKLVRNEYNEMQFVARNNGTTEIKSATLKLKMGDWWTDKTITPAPSKIEGDEYTWNISNLQRDEQFKITVAGEIRSDLDTYNDLCFSGEVSGSQTDVDGGDNRETVEFETVDEMSQVYKQSNLGAFFTPQNDRIKYSIRFQNMSSEILNKITVIDTFDEDLIVPAGLTAIDSSSERFVFSIENLKFAEGVRRMECTWITESAGLAPYGAANKADVGFVNIEFPMHKASREPGIELCNQAVVNFLQHENIKMRTNMVCSKSVNSSVPGMERPSLVELYPNPAIDIVTVANNSYEDRQIQIMDQTGRVIKTVELLPGAKSQLDLSNVTAGLYLVKVVGFETTKLVVQ